MNIIKLFNTIRCFGCNSSIVAKNIFIEHIVSNKRFIINKKVRYFCQNRNNDSSETQLKKLLDASSPLKPSPEVENLWATDPYPTGTVFQEHPSDYDDDASNTKLEPEHTSIIMFPGQGNQFLGMAKNIIQYSVVKDMFESASRILGYDLLKVCEEGPEEKLNKTEYCQPALLVCSLGALEKLKDEKPWAINNCVGTCGFSLGELAALVFAGCISFEKAIMLVKLRAEAMELCCRKTPGGMLTVLYGPGSNLSKALEDANSHCQSVGINNSQCSVASYLFPGCKVIAGHIVALNYLLSNREKYRLRKLSKLPVSGAFHTDLMKSASFTFREALEKVEIKEPLIKVYSNVNGKPYKNSNDIKLKLPTQIHRPVKWEQTMHFIYSRVKGNRFPFTYECGPGKSLSVVLKKINTKASQFCYSVQL